MEEKNINKLMSRFVQEVKQKDGNPYPPSTLVSLVSGIQRYLRENGRAAVSFFYEKDATYDLLRKSVDTKMKTLAKEGIGYRIKQAQPITPEMEHLLWQNNTFGRLTGESLTNMVFGIVAKCLRSMQPTNTESLMSVRLHNGNGYQRQVPQIHGKDLQELARWLTPSKIDSKRPENICQSRAKAEVCCKHI